MGLQDEDLPLPLQRRHHPTQTPIAVWNWFFERHVDKGMLVVDPYAGTAGTFFAARRRGAQWMGCDASWEFAQVAQLRLDGAWGKPQETADIKQLGFETTPNLE